MENVLPVAIGVLKAQHNTSSKRSIIKAAFHPTNLIKATNLDNVKTPKEVCPHIRVSIYSNKPMPKWVSIGNDS